MGLIDEIMRVYNEPDPNPFMFQVGQQVRVVKSVVNDGQTHKCWAGAIATITRRYCTGLHKEHWYEVSLSYNGSLLKNEFREDEFDFRYIRSK